MILLLGGSYISRVTILITHIRVLMTPLITTHEPPSSIAKNKACSERDAFVLEPGVCR